MNTRKPTTPAKRYSVDNRNFDLGHGDVVIAAITSCTNTSNRAFLTAPRLLARKAAAKGLKANLGQDLARTWQPGGRGISRNPACRADLEQVGFNLVGLRLHHLHRQFGPAAGRNISKSINDNGSRRRGAVG